MKEQEYPDVDTNEDKEEELHRRKFFKTRLIYASDWTPDNVLSTTMEHCNSDVHAPDMYNATSIKNCLFRNIRNMHARSFHTNRVETCAHWSAYSTHREFLTTYHD